MGNHHAVARFHLTTKDTLAGILLGVEDHSRSLEVPQALVDTSGLHHTAVLSDIAKEHSQATILGVGVFEVADTALGTIGIE